MCAASLTSVPTSARYPAWKSWLRPSAAGRSPPVWSLQAQSQLKAIYKDNADTIIGNMDSSIFLGGKEPTTFKELAAVLGKETIDTYNTGESRGRETSHSLNYQKLGKDMPYLFVKSSVALNLS